MEFTKADAFVKTHGYELRKIAPLEPSGAITKDYDSGRIDVETSGVPDSSVVTRLVKRG
jgi:hypothetical protein